MEEGHLPVLGNALPAQMVPSRSSWNLARFSACLVSSFDFFISIFARFGLKVPITHRLWLIVNDSSVRLTLEMQWKNRKDCGGNKNKKQSILVQFESWSENDIGKRLLAIHDFLAQISLLKSIFSNSGIRLNRRRDYPAETPTREIVFGRCPSGSSQLKPNNPISYHWFSKTLPLQGHLAKVLIVKIISFLKILFYLSVSYSPK